MSPRHRYQPFYCEENVWWLCQHPRLAAGERLAVFIANAAGRCALWQQRLAQPGQLVVWDYHVVLFHRPQEVDDPTSSSDSARGWRVWDLDSRLPLPVPLDRYLAQTFRPLAAEGGHLAPRFRLVEAERLLAIFSTDRGHMRDGRGGWLHPPPPWSAPVAPGQRANLARFIDPADTIAGQIYDRAALERLLLGGVAQR